MIASAIGIDLDGVLADYWTAYLRLLVLTHPHQSISYHDVHPGVVAGIVRQERGAACFPQDVRDRVFRTIEASADFWLHLSPYPGTRDALARLTTVDRVYFLTRRFGVGVQAQTAAWLASHGYTRPAVIIVPTDATKATIARTLELTALIDDTAAVGSALSRRAPRCLFRLVSRPWNGKAVLRGRSHVRVESLMEALDDLLKGD